MEQQSQEFKPADIAAWAGRSEKGTAWISFKYNDVRYVGFRQEQKKNEKQPDWRIYKDDGEKLEEVGAGWEKETKTGKFMIFMRLKVDGEERTFRLFENPKATAENRQPDLVGWENEPMETEKGAAEEEAAAGQEEPPQGKPPQQQAQNQKKRRLTFGGRDQQRRRGFRR